MPGSLRTSIFPSLTLIRALAISRICSDIRPPKKRYLTRLVLIDLQRGQATLYPKPLKTRPQLLQP